MQTLVQEFNNEQEVLRAAEELKSKGVCQSKLFVLTHDEKQTRKIASDINANIIGEDEQGLGTNVINMFEKTGDQLRNKMEEVGLSTDEANLYEEKLDKGKILLLVKDYDEFKSKM
ncbi:general stress protein [Metabacillus fastidiosus]|uniref:General stress protein n=1 Tax=Metabacillus fastidiosus TaxID=1458 RepID=A0ABU6NTV2_9BACI|nr:general stress protein [Metabacillus fastidiosus]